MPTLMDKLEEVRAKARTKATEIRLKAGLSPEPMILGNVPITERVKEWREKRMAPSGAAGAPAPAPTTVRAGAERPKMIV